MAITERAINELEGSSALLPERIPPVAALGDVF